ncbi:MAG: DUF3786 domain-containing protein [Proteobacteria bacterium]|nr:DUF3786 domain-containing protein [Pseudomonadota bacterium]MBU1740522.1 DUF3786 domain-containing protein [Pseudomonadota bacterium]
MFDSERPEAYRRVYHQLIPRLGEVDWPGVADDIGAVAGSDGTLFEIFNRPVRADAAGVTALGPGHLPVAMRIICCHYVLRGGGGRIKGEWVSYRDFKDAAPFFAADHRMVDVSLGRTFSGRGPELVRAGRSLGAFEADDIPGDPAFGFKALPRVPLRLSFYEADEDFEAEARVLFDRGADGFLDMECLAVTGYLLAELLLADVAPSP